MIFPTIVNLFCDESGNGGSNYFDREQPIHVLAGLLVPELLGPQLVECVGKVRKEYPQGDEAKGKTLLKSDKGRRILADFVDDVFKLGCLPTYTIAERRYCAAAKIVETFCDPFYNSKAEWLPTGANLDRQKVAEVLHGLPDKYLHDFVEAYREPKLASMMSSVESLGYALELSGHHLLANTIRGNLARLDEVVEAEVEESENLRHNIAISLNYPVFIGFLGMNNQFLSERDYEGWVIHDETQEFELAFREAFRTIKAAGARPARGTVVLQDGQPIVFSLDAFKDFRTGKSVLEPEVRGADYIANAVKGVALMALGHKGLNSCPHLKRIAKKVLPPMVFFNSGMIIGSKGFVAQLMKPVKEVLRELGNEEE